METTNKILLIAALTIATAYSASDGKLGETSTGKLNIALEKGDEVKISGLSDVNFGEVTQAPNDKFVDVCIYSTSGSYDVTATSANPQGNDYRLASKDRKKFIKYDLEWKSGANGSGGSDLNNGKSSKKFTNANTKSQNCGGKKNARLFVEIDSGSFKNASSGAYSDVLTVVVSPR